MQRCSERLLRGRRMGGGYRRGQRCLGNHCRYRVADAGRRSGKYRCRYLVTVLVAVRTDLIRIGDDIAFGSVLELLALHLALATT